MSNQTAIKYDQATQDIAIIVINPIASYIALASVVLIIAITVILRLVITIDAKKSDLILFNNNPPKHFDMLVAKPSDNHNAQHNKNKAILAGLMVPPPPTSNDTEKNLGEITEPGRKNKKSKI